MINQIEPTYLRYIYDGLAKGAIHPDNASALPDGLIGLYEEAFEENLSAVERQKLLNQFTIWALLKKEVSANFVAEILGEKEEDILNFIATYSKWFNSPDIGKYQLYHERLRSYILMRNKLNSIIKCINTLNSSLLANEKTEFEIYKLEFLSQHIYNLNFVSKNDTLHHLNEFCFNDNFTQKQIEHNTVLTWYRKSIFYGFLLNGIYEKDKPSKTLFKNWFDSTLAYEIQLKKSIKTLFVSHDSTSFIQLIAQEENYTKAFKEIVYVLSAYIKCPNNKKIITNSIIDFIIIHFPINSKTFKWNFDNSINVNYLLELLNELHKASFDFTFILNLGGVDEASILKFIQAAKVEPESAYNFFSRLLGSLNDNETSNILFEITKVYGKDLNNNQLEEISKQIKSPFIRLRQKIYFGQGLGLIIENITTFNSITPYEQSILIKEAFSNDSPNIKQNNLAILEDLFLKIDSNLNSAIDLDNKNLNEIDFTLDIKTKYRAFSKINLAYCISLLSETKAIFEIENTITLCDEIKSGGIKGETLYTIKQMIFAFNQNFHYLGNKAEGNIPRIGLGGLDYGQFLVGNYIDLSENAYFENKIKESYNYLNKARLSLYNLNSLMQRDNIRVELIKCYLKHNKPRIAENILSHISISELKKSAIRIMCDYFSIKNQSRIISLYNKTIKGDDKQVVLSYLLNNQYSISLTNKQIQSFLTNIFHECNNDLIYKELNELSFYNLLKNYGDEKTEKLISHNSALLSFITKNANLITNVEVLIESPFFDQERNQIIEIALGNERFKMNLVSNALLKTNEKTTYILESFNWSSLDVEKNYNKIQFSEKQNGNWQQAKSLVRRTNETYSREFEALNLFYQYIILKNSTNSLDIKASQAIYDKLLNTDIIGEINTKQIDINLFFKRIINAIKLDDLVEFKNTIVNDLYSHLSGFQIKTMINLIYSKVKLPDNYIVTLNNTQPNNLFSQELENNLINKYSFSVFSKISKSEYFLFTKFIRSERLSSLLDSKLN